MTEPVPRRAVVAAVLLGVGTAALGLTWMMERERRVGRTPRPEGTGLIGFVTIHGAIPDRGPQRLVAGSVSVLPRPQALTFAWTVDGTGPRHVRVEAFSGTDRLAAHEERVEAPGQEVPMGFVVHLDAAAPDELTVVVTIEAPHAKSLVARYPIRLL